MHENTYIREGFFKGCDTNFSQKSNLNKNKNHTSQKPFYCQKCNKGPSRKCAHKTTHNNPKDKGLH